MKRLTLSILATVLLSVYAYAQAPATAVIPADSNEKAGDIRRRTFDIVWKTVKEKHFDPNFGGVDWDKVREQYAPRVAVVKSDQELYRLLQQMLGELHQSHFNIIPVEAVIPDDAREPPSGGIGIDLRMIAGKAVITRVEASSRAAGAGLRSGFVIKKIENKTVEEIAGPIEKLDEPQSRKTVRIVRKLLAELSGQPGSAVSLICLDAKDRQLTLSVEREKLRGELSPPLGNFPPQYTEFELKRLAENIGYIRFNIFTIPIMDKVRAAIRELSGASGLIFDLRGNPGGVSGIATGIAGHLATKEGSLGTMKMRNNQFNFAFFPQNNPYLGPVVILMDNNSGSTSEIFAGGMQEIGRAVIVGERSAGAALPSFFQKLPTGALFQFAIADFKTPNGVLVEGRGVSPDIEVKWDRDILLAGRDAQLEAGIEQIRKRSK